MNDLSQTDHVRIALELVALAKCALDEGAPCSADNARFNLAEALEHLHEAAG